jgi:hypothetical protein
VSGGRSLLPFNFLLFTICESVGRVMGVQVLMAGNFSIYLKKQMNIVTNNSIINNHQDINKEKVQCIVVKQ